MRDEVERALKRQKRARANEQDRHHADLAAALARLGHRPANRGGRGSGKK